MKKIIFSILILASYSISAQDVFQDELYSVDMVLKYRKQIELSDIQAKSIRKIHNDNIAAYNTLKWDLDTEVLKMEELLSSYEVDSTTCLLQLDKVLNLESNLKRVRLGILIGIKNQLTDQQQIALKAYKEKSPNDASINWITPLNENPRVVLKVDGPEIDGNPLFYIIEKKTKRKVKSVKDIDPSDIEAIEVIKGAAAIKLYGEEGKNGVVIIKLKK